MGEWCDGFGVSQTAARLLLQRGIASLEDARRFLFGTWNDLHDPFLFAHMTPACARIERAIAGGERIAIYGDFDSDGVTATALLVHAVRDLGGDVLWYIPDRFGEGHGISTAGVEWIARQDARVAITVDCGIGNREQVEALAQAGIDVIITDHHHPDSTRLPPSALILHPALGGYPFPHLSGAGMALKLVQGVFAHLGQPGERARAYCDLAAIGIVADVSPLVGENRLIVREGLARIEEQIRPPLAALAACAGPGTRRGGRRRGGAEKWNARDLAFLVAPRLNAAGRMERASWALELLLETDPEQAALRAGRLERLNQERQAIEEEILGEINRMLDDSPALLDEPLLLLFAPHWHFGVIGILASRLANRYQRPVFLACRVDGEVRGSARAPKGFSIVAALAACSTALVRHGGHDEAGGFAATPERFGAFRQALLEYARTHPLHPRSRRPDEEPLPLPLADATDALVRELDLLAPFGQGNPVPRFRTDQVILHQQRLVGKHKNHLLLSLYHEGTIRKGLYFDWNAEARGPVDAPLPPGRYEIEYELALDTWRADRDPNASPEVILHLTGIIPLATEVPTLAGRRTVPDSEFQRVVIWAHQDVGTADRAPAYFFVDQRCLKTKSQYVEQLVSRHETLFLAESLEDLRRLFDVAAAFPLHVSLPTCEIPRAFHPLPEEGRPAIRASVRAGTRQAEHLLLCFMPTDWDETWEVLARGLPDRPVKVHLLFDNAHLETKRAAVRGTSKEVAFQELEALFFRDKTFRPAGGRQVDKTQ